MNYREGMISLGKMIRARRHELGLTQTTIARALGVNESYICRLEAGDRFQGITLQNAYKLADILQISVEKIAKTMLVLDEKGKLIK